MTASAEMSSPVTATMILQNMSNATANLYLASISFRAAKKLNESKEKLAQKEADLDKAITDLSKVVEVYYKHLRILTPSDHPWNDTSVIYMAKVRATTVGNIGCAEKCGILLETIKCAEKCAEKCSFLLETIGRTAIAQM